ncbi:MAG: endo-1,4-beta-xylanase [Paludibacter sp.]|jgi:GH35 family endo-1,4-beta-xylanase|nr:endo-1,4-beta-xylanase [Paludibacter sp.]
MKKIIKNRNTNLLSFKNLTGLRGKSVFTLCSLLFVLVFTSCYDEKMQWNDPYNHPQPEELPLQLQEQISRYEALTAYTNIKLGVGIDFNLYMTDAKYRAIVNENFREITPGNETKQSSLMKADGTLDFTYADNVIDALQAAGLTVYGHTLVWHSQQRASYLNALIAPNIIPGPAGESLIDGDFESGMGGFSPGFNAQDYVVVETEALSGTHSLQVTIGSGAAGKYDAQLNSPSFPIIEGHSYEISFFIKCNGEGKLGIDFPDGSLGNQYPYIAGTELVSIGGAWQQVIINPETTGAMLASTDNSAYTFRLLLGAAPSVIYYIDNVVVLDLDATPPPPDYVNMVAHGTFDEYESTDNLSSHWNSWGASSSRELSAEGEGYNSAGKCLIIHSIGGTADYSVQATTNLTESFIIGHEYHVEAMIKSSVAAGSVRIQFQGGDATYLPADATTTVWLKIEHDFTAEKENNKLFFDLGLVEADYYIDNVVVYDKTLTPSGVKKKSPRRAPIIVDKTPEEKAAILEPILKNYITDVASHFAGKMAAWDVVNEPMNENGTVRTGEEDLKATSTFYWMYYLGKDYAVTAFKAARAADPAAKLFINDYNLESAGGSKLNGLIEYVNYIESQGATVDGIGTQVHLDINYADTNAIASMFQKLAATGKLIKISEFDIAIKTDAPSAAQQEEQAKLYEMIVRMFKKYIPEAQQYGITLWGVSDNAAEHEYWLKGDAPNLWDANYARKHAYKGFADGLAGKDVGAEFPGTLEY